MCILLFSLSYIVRLAILATKGLFLDQIEIITLPNRNASLSNMIAKKYHNGLHKSSDICHIEGKNGKITTHLIE
jgi:hypothetical protein